KYPISCLPTESAAGLKDVDLARNPWTTKMMAANRSRLGLKRNCNLLTLLDLRMRPLMHQRLWTCAGKGACAMAVTVALLAGCDRKTEVEDDGMINLPTLAELHPEQDQP